MDTTLEEVEFRNIIRKIQAAGYHVINVSTDMHQGNQGLARKLGVTIEEPYFPNPSANRQGEKIYWMYDAPHLLKLMRNWLIDDGFHLKGEQDIILIICPKKQTIYFVEFARCRSWHLKIRQSHLNFRPESVLNFFKVVFFKK